MENHDRLRKLQIIQADILSKVDKLCDEHAIEYFLIGGSALGAYRHQGFIPWDDDIDLGMTRKDYEKFLQIAPSYLEKTLYLQTLDTDPKSPFPYAKIRMNGTKFVEWCNRETKMHQGIYIDIFPYDNIPDSETLRRKQFNTVQFYSRLLAWKRVPYLSKKPSSVIDVVKGGARRIINLLFKILPSAFILKNLNKSMCMYNTINTSAKACLLFPVYMKESMSNDVLFPIKKIIFEGKEFPVCCKLDVYLETHYGDYMALPPETARHGHLPHILEF